MLTVLGLGSVCEVGEEFLANVALHRLDTRGWWWWWWILLMLRLIVAKYVVVSK